MELADGIYSLDYGIALPNQPDVETKPYSRSYIWNEKNQLKTSVENGFVVNYRYGEDGQRAVKSSAQGETLYFNNIKDDQYDRALRISSNSDTDAKLVAQGDKLYQNPYSLRENSKGQNCGDLVGDIVINSNDDNIKGNKKGVLGFTIPNMQYKQFIKDNKTANEIDI